MLVLLRSPVWAAEGQPPRPLPPTLPAALLLVLAAAGGWMTREQLALVFWPDVTAGDALHRLRINLHRARRILSGWGQDAALQTERARLCLHLRCDLADLMAAQAAGDAGALERLNPAHWLQGWRLPGNGSFSQWCDETAAQLQAGWLAASRRCQAAAAAPTAPAVQGGLPLPAAPPGRAAELHRLLHSPAPAFLLLGEPGAGKTTLLQAAAHAQAPVLRGLEGLHAMPYRPLLDTLRLRLPLLERALRNPGHPLRPYRLDLARVLPELAPDEPLPPLDALTARTRLVEALARAFESLTPVLLVDDLHWCDPATVEWLVMLAHGGRLCWRAAARQHDITPALEQALQGLRSAGRLEEMQVPPLTRDGVADACCTLWPEQPFSAARLDRLHALSGGNAFLVGELVAAGLAAEEDAPLSPLPERVTRLVLARVQGLPALARDAVQAAAVFVQPVPASALRHAAGPPGAAGDGGALAWEAACEHAVAAGLLRVQPQGLACRHDLIRQAVARALPPRRRAALHRHAALWLASQPDLPAPELQPAQPPPEADALTIAEHWRAAGEPQTALAWRHRGADQLKARGRFDQARALWREVADESLDATQALRARLELAACDLFEDLGRGEAALEAVLAQLGAVADAEQHRLIQSRALAALVDNRVFAGDLAQAEAHAQRLRELLPALPAQERIYGVQVLIELAMRQPDMPAAWALLSQLRTLAPRRPMLLSYEGQIHWFGGQVQAAHDTLARLLERHPDHCRGITVENDLAVMLQALGRIDEAEDMARRSLQSWAGVAHTETLSLLALGLVLTSAGRYAEADAALLHALQLAREQASPGFEAEAQVRRAGLLLRCGCTLQAQAALDSAAPLLAASPEPLRVSQLVLAQVLAATAAGRPVPPIWPARLHAVAARSQHPLVHVRLARVAHAVATAAGDHPAAARAAADMAACARRAGLLEPLAEALLLCARAVPGEAAASACAREAAALAARQGFADLSKQADSLLNARGPPD